MLRVDLEEKFTSLSFEKVVSTYWRKSFEEKNIRFTLSKLEWVAIEQMTFLVSWINKLVESGKKVEIELPSITGLPPQSYTYNRRLQCANYILIDWRLQNLIDSKVSLLGDIRATKPPKNKLPYEEIESMPYNASTFDNDFDTLYETSISRFGSYIANELNENTLLNYFDNHFLHYSLLKEFYSNVCQHAYPEKQDRCFLSLKLNSKITTLKGKALEDKLIDRYRERPTEEQEFFKDIDERYINTSFIELTFMDFGMGIVNTLREKYQSEDKGPLKDKLTAQEGKHNEDTLVLEYAFLLFTSKYELGKDLEMHDYIPRGLYIVKDIVKRYQGMIVARSGKGKVIFNFRSDAGKEVLFRENDFEPNIGEGLQGTSLSIILPARVGQRQTKPLRIKAGAEAVKSKTHIIQLLQYVTAVTKEEEVKRTQNESEKKTKLLEAFFKNLCTDLIKIKSPTDLLLLFDFGGIERSTFDIYSKLIYFLIYCPLLDEHSKACIFNILEKGIDEAFVSNQELARKSKGFFTKPIPCIYPDQSTGWIGINDKSLENQITAIWKDESIDNETVKDIHHLAGGLIMIVSENDNKTIFSITIPKFTEVTTLIHLHNQKIVELELTDKRIDFTELMGDDRNYNIVLNGENKSGSDDIRAFLTSNGKFQKEFITFIEKLYIREYRRLLATYFINNLFFERQLNIDAIRKSTKVLTVTLSSQLLGREFVEIVNDLSFTEHKLSLIPLSSYYDFNTEDAFDDVHEGDRIIVVNDVISSGNLSTKILESVHEKKALIACILTVVDSRVDEDKTQEISSHVVSLHSRPIEKFGINPFNTSPIWINPILNAPTTMSRSKSSKESILKHPQEFINYFKDDYQNDDLFRVGFFKQNTRYLTYYLQTDVFFQRDKTKSFHVTTSIIDELKKRISNEKNVSHRPAEHKFKSWLSKKTDKLEISEEAIVLLEDYLKETISTDTLKNETHIDFIFYPFISAVSEIEKNLSPISHTLRGNSSIEIYPLPRIMTPRGWRFTFPPKFLNFRTREKTALILDDGSCTGETIVQMIDMLSFLELKEIFVLSIFGRLEDFQREFLSRIRKVKVRDKANLYKAIPVSVYFATHFHIPIYNKNNHPQVLELAEMKDLEMIYAKNSSDMPKHLEKYFQKRRTEIGRPLNPRNHQEQISIIPSTIQRKLMFLIRDSIGNYESYRLFKEDEIDFNETQETNELSFWNLGDILEHESGKDALLAVLVLEPHLVSTIQRIYPEMLSNESTGSGLIYFIETQIKRFNQDLGSEYFHFYIVGLGTINFESFYNFNFMNGLLNKVEELSFDTHHSFNYLAYKFSSLLYKTAKNGNSYLHNNAKLAVQRLYQNINRNNLHSLKYASLIKELYNETLADFATFPGRKELMQLIRVQEYYKRQVSNTHGTKEPSHPNIYVYLSHFINKIGRFEISLPSDDEKTELAEKGMELIKSIDAQLFNDLKPVLTYLFQFFKQFGLPVDIPAYLKMIDEYERRSRRIKATSLKDENFKTYGMAKFRKWLKSFQSTFFHLSSDLPKFFINDEVELGVLVTQILNDFKSNKGNTNISNDITQNVKLQVHQYFLGMVLYELVENKWKYARDAEATLTFDQTDSEVKITYTQESPFIENVAENGLILIRNIVRRYGGRPQMRTSQTQYHFEIRFSKDIIID